MKRKRIWKKYCEDGSRKVASVFFFELYLFLQGFMIRWRADFGDAYEGTRIWKRSGYLRG